MANEHRSIPQRVADVRSRVDPVRDRAQRMLLWRVWERLLEIEFVDRSVALAGKAFVSFFPLVIVVAAFCPSSVRNSIFTTLTARLGIRGDALTTAKEAFATSDDVRKATGLLGLVLTIFFASSFTTAVQRVYLRAWRRPPGGKAGAYTRGPAWLIVVLASMALLGAVRGVLGNGPGLALFAVISLATTSGAVVVHRLVPPAGRSARAGPPPVRGDHEHRDGRLRRLRHDLDAERRHAATKRSSASSVSRSRSSPGSPAPRSASSSARARVRCSPRTRGRSGGSSAVATRTMLTPGARPALPPPARDLTLRDAFQPVEET